MPQYVPTQQTQPQTGTLSDLGIIANNAVTYNLFCPTYRTINAQISGNPSDGPQFRNQQRTFARGYKETTTVRIKSSVPFRWRRLVFSLKGLDRILQAALPSVWNSNYVQLLTSQGYARQTAILDPAIISQVNAVIFRGAESRDWFSTFNAKVDTTRIKIHSDKTRTFNPGNQSGMVRTIKNWYPLNKTLLYGDDEFGLDETTSGFASPGPQGMGDMFVYDIYQSAFGLTDPTNDIMSINHEGTYYWHER